MPAAGLSRMIDTITRVPRECILPCQTSGLSQCDHSNSHCSSRLYEHCSSLSDRVRPPAWRYNQLRMDTENRIVIDPKICHGKPIIRATRLPVAIVLGSLAGGMSFDEVQREYSISIDDIRAAIGYANALVEREQHHPLPA